MPEVHTHQRIIGQAPRKIIISHESHGLIAFRVHRGPVFIGGPGVTVGNGMEYQTGEQAAWRIAHTGIWAVAKKNNRRVDVICAAR